MRCKVCNKELVDEKGYCHGVEVYDDIFICDPTDFCEITDCIVSALAVVEAARAVVAVQYDALQSDAEDVAQIWDAIGELWEALGE